HVGGAGEAAVDVVAAVDLLGGVEGGERGRGPDGAVDRGAGRAGAAEDDVLAGVLIGGADEEAVRQVLEAVGHAGAGELALQPAAEAGAGEDAGGGEAEEGRERAPAAPEDVEREAGRAAP